MSKKRRPVTAYELPLEEQLRLIKENIEVCERMNDVRGLVKRLKRQQVFIERNLAKKAQRVQSE